MGGGTEEVLASFSYFFLLTACPIDGAVFCFCFLQTCLVNTNDITAQHACKDFQIIWFVLNYESFRRNHFCGLKWSTC